MQQLQERGVTDSCVLLTDRGREVLQLLAEGRSNKEVAALLDVGVSTVETHPRESDAEAESARRRFSIEVVRHDPQWFRGGIRSLRHK